MGEAAKAATQRAIGLMRKLAVPARDGRQLASAARLATLCPHAVLTQLQRPCEMGDQQWGCLHCGGLCFAILSQNLDLAVAVAVAVATIRFRLQRQR